MNKPAAVALALCASVFGAAHLTTAQSRPAAALARSSFASVHRYVAADAIPRHLAMPPNLVVSDVHRQMLETVLRHSPTFRRQCMRLAAEPNLTVHVRTMQTFARSDIRATTRISRRPNGRIVALVDIGRPHDIVELVAHELEHVIEQLDGVDLASQAARPDTGVSVVPGLPNVFETLRATQIGRQVARESSRK